MIQPDRAAASLISPETLRTHMVIKNPAFTFIQTYNSHPRRPPSGPGRRNADPQVTPEVEAGVGAASPSERARRGAGPGRLVLWVVWVSGGPRPRSVGAARPGAPTAPPHGPAQAGSPQAAEGSPRAARPAPGALPARGAHLPRPSPRARGPTRPGGGSGAPRGRCAPRAGERA